MTKTRRLSNDECSQAMADRREFRNRTGSLWGQWFDDLPDTGPGVLPVSYVDELKELAPVYVVYSYETPIAWATAGDELLTVPDVNYSLTTSQHQQACLNVPGEYRWIDGQFTTIRPSRRIGRLHNNGTPTNTFSKGKGRTPFRERVGY
jgi:hypothetical protein